MSKRKYSFVGKYFRTTEFYVGEEGSFWNGYPGKVVASVGANNYLIKACKAPNFTQRVVSADFFIASGAVIFDTFEAMKAAERKSAA